MIVSFVKDSYAKIILRSATTKKFEKIRDSRYFSYYLLRHLEDNKINCHLINEYVVKSQGINDR